MDSEINLTNLFDFLDISITWKYYLFNGVAVLKFSLYFSKTLFQRNFPKLVFWSILSLARRTINQLVLIKNWSIMIKLARNLIRFCDVSSKRHKFDPGLNGDKISLAHCLSLSLDLLPSPRLAVAAGELN